MGRRTILLIAAVVVAALGAVLVFVYAHDANKRAEADQSPVNVLVAKTDIAAGTTGSSAQSSGAFVVKSVPRSALTPGALTSSSPISSQYALATIFTGQQIISQQWGSTAPTPSSLPIPTGKVAVSVQLGDPARVAGFVEPGSDVAVFNTLDNSTQVLITSAEVIATGPTTLASAAGSDASGTQNTEQLPKALMTLALNQKDAQKLIYASQNGQVYFALLSGTSKVKTGNPTNQGNLYN